LLGAECIVGALCFVPAEMKVEPRKVLVGNPAKIIKDVSDEMIEWKTEGTKIYQQLPKDCFNGLKEVEPLREIPADRKVQDSGYKTWKENQ
jgi:carbonic anhydrase/acetyltransferase-like protein (isoleucine patch superfamily)